RMTVEALLHHPSVSKETILLAAFLSVRNPFLYPLGEEAEARSAQDVLAHPLGDALTAVRTHQAFQKAHDPKRYCETHYLDPELMSFISRACEQLEDIAKSVSGLEWLDSGGDPDLVLRCMVAGFPDKVLQKRRRGFTYEGVGGLNCLVHPSSVLFNARSQFIVATELVRSNRTYARNCSIVKPDWLAELPDDIIRELNIDKPRRGKKKRAGSESSPDVPTEIIIGRVTLPIRIRKGQAQVSVPLERVPDLIKAGVDELPPQFRRARAVLKGKRGRIGGVVALSSLLRLLPHMPLPKPNEHLQREELGSAILDAEANWATIEHYLDQLLQPYLPHRGKRPGWLALVATGTGDFWYEVIPDYWAAVQSTMLSLDALADSLPVREYSQKVRDIIEGLRPTADAIGVSGAQPEREDTED
ncbi:MAG: hypothetical protein KC561_17315, partial [Myxococcales bacterium]|nr:hypothetical protein [Myxococcales bacterium]